MVTKAWVSSITTVAGSPREQRFGPYDRAKPTATGLHAEVRTAESKGPRRSTIPFSDPLRPLLSSSVKLRAKQVATNAISAHARRRAGALQGRSLLRLHLGSGGNNLDGWLNIDLVGAHADLAWDVRRPLPFADGIAEAIFLERVFEHMTLEGGMSVLCHCRRVLAPGGVLRVGILDAGLCAAGSIKGRGTAERVRPESTTMLALSEVRPEHGQVSAWDDETLCLVVEESGYLSVEVVPRGSSRIQPTPDSQERIPATMYVEAVSPS